MSLKTRTFLVQLLATLLQEQIEWRSASESRALAVGCGGLPKIFEKH